MDFQNFNRLPNTAKYIIYTLGVVVILFIVGLGTVLTIRIYKGDNLKVSGVEINSNNPINKPDSINNKEEIPEKITKDKVELKKETKNKAKGKKSDSKFDNSNSTFNGNTQIGDNNIQNNIGHSQREADETTISLIISHIPSINSTVIINKPNTEIEPFNYAKSIVKALEAKGYNNCSISTGTVYKAREAWYGFPGDEERNLAEEKKFVITNEDGRIFIDMPLH
jgi:hypothetical protein